MIIKTVPVNKELLTGRVSVDSLFLSIKVYFFGAYFLSQVNFDVFEVAGLTFKSKV